MRKSLKMIIGLLVLLIVFFIAALVGYFMLNKPRSDSPVLAVGVIANLHKYVQETSSLAYIDGQYWTTNDSGDGPYLYRINPDRGSIEGTVKLLNSDNQDWESLAQDEENLYVFDCGNNKADRASRSVMQVSLSALAAAKYDDKSDAEVNIVNKREFVMADQPDDLVPFIHDFDCEAATVIDDELWIFSKNWQDFASRVYRLPLTEFALYSDARIALQPSQTLPVSGLVTAADFDTQSQRLVLLGYDNNMFAKQAFVWFIPVQNGLLDWSMAQRFDLDTHGQWESIIWRDSSQLLITAEATFSHKARVAVIKVPIL